MSGNFDFPPATVTGDSTPITPLEEDSRIHDLVRDVIRRRRIQRQIIMDRQDSSRSTEGLRTHWIREASIQEEIHRRSAARESQASGGSVPEMQAPTSAIRSRPQAMPAERYVRAHRTRRHERPTFAGNASTIQQAVERLNEASTSLSSLLDQPMPRVGPSSASTRPSGETEVNRRRAKRRKLDGGSYPSDSKSFSYGYRGQVVSGPLKMEIVSCDGGLHPDSQDGNGYVPDNLLRNDKSVYCTDSSKCNIIMCHQGETAFCLQKIIIKAPERGFTAPIQEGLIFVSMKSNDLLAQTSQYRIREASPRSPDNPIHSGVSLRSYTMPGQVIETRPPSRRINDAGERTIPPPISNVAAYTNTPRPPPSPQPPTATLTPQYAHLMHGDDSSPSRWITNIANPLTFTVTTDCSDHSGEEEEESSAATIEDRNRRDRMPPILDSSSDSTEDGDASRWARPQTRGAPRHRRSRRRAIPSRVEVAARTAADDVRDGTEGQPPAEILAPHAKFFIEKDKSMVSIKFNPPISGRFILLKLWSPAKEQNIDIQNIAVHGFAGLRFFPAADIL